MELLKKIEEKWQRSWEKARIFEADPDPTRKKFFVTFPFSYMNGPLHVGHGFTAARCDVYARFRRMQGYNVLFPWAWHWTGGPLAGASERIQKGDESFIKALLEIDGVPKEELEKFVDPVYMASYYTNESRKAVKQAGFSVDWRREFHTTSPAFNKFIEWQYLRLKDLGYVKQGTHPVVWCPKCQSPTADHDRQEGLGVSPEEYTLMKFKYEDAYMPAATFRPETIYGVTNMWVNPDADYVKAQVNGEKWIVSKETTQKLREQQREVAVLTEFKGKELIGKECINPVDGRKILILPAWFVDPKHATGVVYSVPSHAPYDWLALKDLKEKTEVLRQFGINPDEVKKIEPISLIQVEGFGEHPAVELVEKLGAKGQHDPKAEEATKILYKKEFHSGVLKAICGKYSGKLVREIKEKLIQDFKQEGIADSMYDLPQKVVCRCMTPCIVKVLKDQWFLTFSDPEWKARAREALSRMAIYPETARQWFLDTIEWLKEWACARKTGLGTPLPWSPEWIVETLSDSTIYMAFYTIRKHIQEHNIKPESLTPEVFDYIFYGKGNAHELSEKCGINLSVLESMRQEFTYWYPVDLRNSAKELLPNHLTLFIFHHVALFPPEHWPKAVAVNGMLMIEGKKMSKSKGNFITLKKAIQEFGADATRTALLLSAEGMDDPDWRRENVRDIKSKLETFYRLAENIIQNSQKKEETHLEEWLMSRLQHRIETVTKNIEIMKTRTALDCAFFEVWNDLRWYLRRKGNFEAKILRDFLSVWVRLMAPFAPHLCEEIWSKMGEKGFVSTAEWPKFDKTKVNIATEEIEKLVKKVLEDTLNVMRATKITPKQVCYYVATPWKWKVYLKVLERSLSKKVEMNEMMKELMKDEELKSLPKKVAKFLSQIVKEVNEMAVENKRRLLQAGVLDEHKALKESAEFFKKELNAKIHVWLENDPERVDPKGRAELAKPHRPAIYLE